MNELAFEADLSCKGERLDKWLSEQCADLTRNAVQKLIESESVFIDGRTAYSGGYDLKAGSRVSVRGHGKFIYLGTTNTTRKGRLFVTARVFR